MASSLAAAVPHASPAAPLQHIPRIRPPRFLKSQPRDIDIPQPAGPVPVEHESEIWVQGKWRNRASNAAVDRQKVLSQQVKKAIQRPTHGCNIYAYYHLRTNQVVYSTSRIMRPGQILPQLIFHGKKTVPSGLRRDVWRPYFSIHFPETDSGKRIGLDVYKRLREFASRRQLNPDPESLLATQIDIDRALRAGGDPIQVRELYKNPDHKRKLELPILGQKLSLRYRARRMMDQKATSVADVAYVLGQAVEPLRTLRLNARKSLEQKTASVMAKVGSRAQKTLKFKRASEEEKALQIEDKQKLVDTAGMKPGSIPLDRKKAEQIALEFDGAVSDDGNRVVNLNEIPKRPTHEYEGVESDILILWADVRDGTYASSWSEGIYHGELQPLALNKRAVMAVAQPEYRAEDGTIVSEQKQHFIHTVGKTVHVHGRQSDPRFTTFQNAIAQQMEQRRVTRETQVDSEEQGRMTRFLISMYEKRQQLEMKAAHAQAKDDLGETLSPEEQQAIADLAEIDEECVKYDEANPRAAKVAEETVRFRQTVVDFVNIQAATQQQQQQEQQPLLQPRLQARQQQERSQSGTGQFDGALSTESLKTLLQELEEISPARFMAVRTFLEEQRLLTKSIQAIKAQQDSIRESATHTPKAPAAQSEPTEVDIAQKLSELQVVLQRETAKLDSLEWNAVQGLIGDDHVTAAGKRMKSESEADYLKRTQGVVVQENKGLWARVKGLFRRS